MHRLRVFLWLLFGLPAVTAAQADAPYRDARLPVAERVRDLIGRMSREEKFWQLYMMPGDLSDSTHDYSHGIFGLQIGAPADDTPRAHAARINAIQRYFVERTRLGIPIIPFDEALHGLVRPGATAFPQAIALAASWDTALIERVASAIARETRARGVRQVLSPVLNLARDVRWGRVEETYGEDPLLAAAMGRAFIAPFERTGVVTTPKHFVANVGEGGRDSYPIDLGERELREEYFPPFESAVRDAHARSLMTAYNSVDGTPATQNRWLLTDVLKHGWGFEGFTISDAAATGGPTVLQMTEPDTRAAAQHAWLAGLDVVFQTAYEQYRPYWEAFQSGVVPDSVITAAVARVLRVKFELGLFERPYVDEDSANAGNGTASNRALALEAARAGIVLLKNAHRMLPLPSAIRSLALIGPDAAAARLGGYSGPGNRVVSILQGVSQRLGNRTRVRYVPGPGRESQTYSVVPARQLSLRGEYFDNIDLMGAPRFARADSQIDFGWTLESPGPGITRDWYSVRWSGAITIPPGGVRRLGVAGSDGYRLFLDERLLIDNWRKRTSGVTTAPVRLLPGTKHGLRLEYHETTGNAHVQLVWETGKRDLWHARIDSAVAAVKVSDVAIVVAGLEEGEFRDRAFLGLPGHQADLVRAVAAVGKPVVVVLVGGSAVTMPWLDQVDAVLDAWYLGEAGGAAVADVLFGDVNPAGRLPITFPIAEGQLPLTYDHKPTGRGDDYVDLTGQPLFPFGFGLSYTSFNYSDLTITPDTIGPDGLATVRCRVQNVGDRAGDEVVQLYIHDELASVARPVLSLKGFSRIHLAPGETREVTFTLGPEALRMLDRERHWVVEPGAFRVLVGASSKDLRLRGQLVVR